MSWNWAALTPHPPIIVPEVGRGHEREASATVEGMSQVTDRAGPAMPQCLLGLSPHQPYVPGCLFINSAVHSAGSFAPFGAPQVTFELSSPQAVALSSFIAERIAVKSGPHSDLTSDQGSLVPLYFFKKAWGALPPVVLASPIGLDRQTALQLGEVLAGFDDGCQWSLLASGDLSHRLTPSAPAGYSRLGRKFDEAVVASLKSCDPAPIMSLSEDEIDDAGECGMRSVLVLLGFCRAMKITPTVLSYEGPFGVGYCTAFCPVGGAA